MKANLADTKLKAYERRRRRKVRFLWRYKRESSLDQKTRTLCSSLRIMMRPTELTLISVCRFLISVTFTVPSITISLSRTYTLLQDIIFIYQNRCVDYGSRVFYLVSSWCFIYLLMVWCGFLCSLVYFLGIVKSEKIDSLLSFWKYFCLKFSYVIFFLSTGRIQFIRVRRADKQLIKESL